MYACGEDDSENVEKHTNIVKLVCEGRQSCEFTACDEFFDTDPGCVDVSPKLWLWFSCDGEDPEFKYKILKGSKAECLPPPTPTTTTTATATTTTLRTTTPTTADPGIPIVFKQKF